MGSRLREEDFQNGKFWRLTVEGTRRDDKGSLYCWCRCECGQTTEVIATRLRRGVTKSCGCLRNETTGVRSKTHGESKTALYRIWGLMIDRCTNPLSPSYPQYGERGIVVCDKWKQAYEAFRDDIGQPPSPQHSLDRINNAGNYEPGNVRWATKKEQAQNTRRNNVISAFGLSKPLCE